MVWSNQKTIVAIFTKTRFSEQKNAEKYIMYPQNGNILLKRMLVWGQFIANQIKFSLSFSSNYSETINKWMDRFEFGWTWLELVFWKECTLSNIT